MLEETGFNKAVRMREELIRWKTRLIDAARENQGAQNKHRAQLRDLKTADKAIQAQLAGVRNILRIPREAKEKP